MADWKSGDSALSLLDSTTMANYNIDYDRVVGGSGLCHVVENIGDRELTSPDRSYCLFYSATPSCSDSSLHTFGARRRRFGSDQHHADHIPQHTLHKPPRRLLLAPHCSSNFAP